MEALMPLRLMDGALISGLEVQQAPAMEQNEDMQICTATS